MPFRDILQDGDAAVLQEVKDLRIMDQGTEGGDPAAFLAHHIEGGIDRPPHPHAEAGISGKNYFHELLCIGIEEKPGIVVRITQLCNFVTADE